MEMMQGLPLTALSVRAEKSVRPSRQESARDAQVEQSGAFSFPGVLQRQQEAATGPTGKQTASQPEAEAPGEAGKGPGSAPAGTSATETAIPAADGNQTAGPVMIGQMVRILMGQQDGQAASLPTAHPAAQAGTAVPEAAPGTVAQGDGTTSPIDIHPTAGQDQTAARIDLEKLAAVLQKSNGPGPAAGKTPGADAASGTTGQDPLPTGAKPAAAVLVGLLPDSAPHGLRPVSDLLPRGLIRTDGTQQPAPDVQTGAPTAGPDGQGDAGAGSGLEMPLAGTPARGLAAGAAAGEPQSLPGLKELSGETEAGKVPLEATPHPDSQGQAEQETTQQAPAAPTTIAQPTGSDSGQIPAQEAHRTPATEATGQPAATLAPEMEAPTAGQSARVQTLDAAAVRPGLLETAQNIRSQVVRELAATLDGSLGNEKITLHLNPEKLGQVELQFTARGNDLNVVIIASGREAEQALREGVKELAEGIADKSVRWQQVDIKVEQRGQDQDKNDSRQDARRDQSRREGKQDQGQNHQQHHPRPGGGPDWASLHREG